MGGFDVTDYESVLASVVPGDPDGSPLYALQVAGGHAGQLDDDALSLVRDWIAAGAP
jgi:hypothetical protein